MKLVKKALQFHRHPRKWCWLAWRGGGTVKYLASGRAASHLDTKLLVVGPLS